MAEESLEISVVLISWNQREFLETLVGQLLNQDLPPDQYEIIIVDDGSTDGSREWLSQQTDKRIRAVLGNENRGRSTSRNQGIRSARSHIIVMLDGDHTVNRNFLSIHLNQHKNRICAIVGLSQFVEHPDFRALSHYLNGGGASKLPSNTKLPGRYFLTRNCSVPKNVLEQIGMFDEQFVAWGGEDLDLGVKLENAGIPIYGAPDAIAIHHHLRPLDELLKNLFFYGRDSIPILLKKHPQLFRELNLDHSISGYNGRFGPLHRFFFHMMFSAPFYTIAKAKANILRNFHLPRLLFDYLHLRQYTLGYLEYLRHTRNC